MTLTERVGREIMRGPEASKRAIAIVLEEAAKVADIETADCVRCAGTGDAIRALAEDKP